MPCLISIAHVAAAVLFFTCMLWSEVSAQCTDPLIYKLDDIQQLIANLTVKQEEQTANITMLTAEIQSYREQLENQAEQLENQAEQLEKQVPYIKLILTQINNSFLRVIYS